MTQEIPRNRVKRVVWRAGIRPHLRMRDAFDASWD